VIAFFTLPHQPGLDSDKDRNVFPRETRTVNSASLALSGKQGRISPPLSNDEAMLGF